MGTNNRHYNLSTELKLLELVALRIGQLKESAYCIDMHRKELEYMGENELRISLLCVWDKVPYFSKKESVVLRLTDSLIKFNKSTPSDEIYNALILFYNQKEIDCLVLAIKQVGSWTRLMKTLEGSQ